MVEVDKDYRFEGPDGEVGLTDLFEGRRQLIVGHFMFDPAWEDGCSSCTAGADEMSAGHLEHLHARDTTLRLRLARAVSRRSPPTSSAGLDLSLVLVVRHVTSTTTSASRSTRRSRPWSTTSAPPRSTRARGWSSSWPGEFPGRSSFLRDGDRVFHTYSVYARGLETIGGSYYLLDETALGRQEDWEEPKGRAVRVRAAPSPTSRPDGWSTPPAR